MQGEANKIFASPFFISNCPQQRQTACYVCKIHLLQT